MKLQTLTSRLKKLEKTKLQRVEKVWHVVDAISQKVLSSVYWPPLKEGSTITGDDRLV